MLYLQAFLREKGMEMEKTSPPNDLPVYRMLTGPDDATFCHKVTAAIEMGYKLYGSPAATFNGERVIVAQAVIWPTISA